MNEQHKPVMGLIGGVSVIVGTVIGVGIFITLGDVARGSGTQLPLVFALGVVPNLLSALVVAALASALPTNGGSYHYPNRLVSRRLGALPTLLLIIGILGGMAAVARGLASYIDPGQPLLPFALVLIAALISAVGRRFSLAVQAILILQLLTSMLIYALGGSFQGEPVKTSPESTGALVEAFIASAFSYIGLTVIGEIGQEMKEPRRNIPLALLGSALIIAGLYVLIGRVFIGTPGWQELATTETAYLDAARHFLPSALIPYLHLGIFAGGFTSFNAFFFVIPREIQVLEDYGYIRPSGARTRVVLIVIAAWLLLAVGFSATEYGILCVTAILVINIILALALLRLEKRLPDETARAAFRLPGPLASLMAGLTILSAVLLLVPGIVFLPHVVLLPIPLLLMTWLLVRAPANP